MLHLEELGKFIKSGHVYLEYFGGLAVGILLLLILISIPNQDKKLFIVWWFVKLFTILVVLPIFFRHYDYCADSFSYYKFAKNIYAEQGSFGSLWQIVTKLIRLKLTTSTFVRYIAAVLYPIFPSYFALNLVFSFIPIFGFMKLFAFIDESPTFFRYRKSYKVILLFFPPVFFWTSLFGKEPLTLLLLSLNFYYIWNFFKLNSLRSLIGIGITTLLLYNLKFWMAKLVVLNTLFIMGVNWQRYLLVGKHSFFAVVSSGSIVFCLKYDILMRVVYKVPSLLAESVDYINVAAKRLATIKSGTQQIPFDIDTWQDFLFMGPMYILVTMFEPFFWKLRNLYMLVDFIFNTSIWLSLILFSSVLLWIEPKQVIKYIFDNYMCMWLGFFIVGFFYIYYPIMHINLGTASRIKVMIYPFAVILTFQLHNLFLIYVRNRDKTQYEKKIGINT